MLKYFDILYKTHLVKSIIDTTANNEGRMNINSYIEESISSKKKILENKTITATIQKISDIIIEAYEQGKKVLLAGNGGSAADAQHIACELVSKFHFDRAALSAFALTTNTSVLTAIANDYGYEHVFSRQIQANGQKGDVFIALSTSGNSKNILKALDEAKLKGMLTVGLSGEKGSLMDEKCDYLIKIPSSCTPVIQESHIMIGHIICALVEKEIFGDED